MNIVGDHASSHARYDAPLASDIAGFARPVSDWVHSSTSARSVGADAARELRERAGEAEFLRSMVRRNPGCIFANFNLDYY